MKAQLRFVIETSSIQAATALRDRAAKWLADEGAGVAAADSSQIQDRWRVRGAETTTRKAFDQIVEAANEQAAANAVASATKIVVLVEPAG